MSEANFKKIKVLVCGILPPPNFGHSMMYKMLIESSFVQENEVIFLNLHFWTYGKHKKVTFDKLFKMVQYLCQYAYLIVRYRPRYVLYNMSFDKMPFLKDYLFCLVGFCAGRRFILHDMGQYLPELYNNNGKAFRSLIKHMLRMTTAIIVMGEKVRQEYQEFLPAERLIVVPGVVEDTVNITVPVLPKKDPQETRVLYFSFLSVSKGIWTALKAMPLALKADPHITFKLAGPMESPELQGQMNEFIAKEGMKDKVEYIGYVEGVEKRTECFRNADIFIFPTHRDVFGLVLLHAMAESIPVIASREGTIPEIVDDAKSGFLFEKGKEEQLAQKILELAKDASLRKRMGACGRDKYKRCYSPEVYGRSMTEAFKLIEHIK